MMSTLEYRAVWLFLVLKLFGLFGLLALLGLLVKIYTPGARIILI
jgi:hypothetical protein